MGAIHGTFAVKSQLALPYLIIQIPIAFIQQIFKSGSQSFPAVLISLISVFKKKSIVIGDSFRQYDGGPRLFAPEYFDEWLHPFRYFFRSQVGQAIYKK